MFDEHGTYYFYVFIMLYTTFQILTSWNAAISHDTSSGISYSVVGPTKHVFFNSSWPSVAYIRHENASQIRLVLR